MQGVVDTSPEAKPPPPQDLDEVEKNGQLDLDKELQSGTMIWKQLSLTRHWIGNVRLVQRTPTCFRYLIRAKTLRVTRRRNLLLWRMGREQEPLVPKLRMIVLLNWHLSGNEQVVLKSTNNTRWIIPKHHLLTRLIHHRHRPPKPQDHGQHVCPQRAGQSSHPQMGPQPYSVVSQQVMWVQSQVCGVVCGLAQFPHFSRRRSDGI